MLKTFEVQGFRNFKNRMTIHFDKAKDYRFNEQFIKDGYLNTILIYGKNGVGKSNLGNAIFDIKENFMSNHIYQTSNYLNADSIHDYAYFNYVFQFDDIEVAYSYKKNEKRALIEERLEVGGQVLFDYVNKTKIMREEAFYLLQGSNLNLEFIDENASLCNYLIVNTSLEHYPWLRDFADFVKAMKPIRGNITARNDEPLLMKACAKIIENDLVDEFEKFLHAFDIQENLVAIKNPDGHRSLYFKHDKLIDFIENCSSGTGALTLFFSAFYTANKISFLYLDEFDAFYHYELAEKIIHLLGDVNKCQCIITTHNTNLLSNKLMRPDCYYILTNESITPITEATDRELREGHNLEKLYKSGEFHE